MQRQSLAYFDVAFADAVSCKSTARWVYLIHGCVVGYDSVRIKRVVHLQRLNAQP